MERKLEYYSSNLSNETLVYAQNISNIYNLHFIENDAENNDISHFLKLVLPGAATMQVKWLN